MPDKNSVGLSTKKIRGIDMTDMKRYLKSEKGAVEVVEAAFVFPVVFFVVILLIFMGNMFFQQAKMDAIAVRGAEYLAAVYTHPILAKNSIPTDSTQVNVKPYRYLLGDSDTESKAKRKIKEWIDSTGTGLLSGMNVDAKISVCRIKNYVLYQTAEIQIDYSIKLVPLNFFDIEPLVRCSTATVVAATDSAEFIRNIDMIMDYSEEFGLTDKIQEFVGAFMG